MTNENLSIRIFCVMNDQHLWIAGLFIWTIELCILRIIARRF